MALFRFDSKPNSVCNYMMTMISIWHCLLRCHSWLLVQEMRLATTANTLMLVISEGLT